MSKELAYFVGLWEGDGYYWSRSIGITNRNVKILEKARVILETLSNIKAKEGRDKNGLFRVYINSSNFCNNWDKTLLKLKEKLSDENIVGAYFAGKYDADGCKWKNRNKFKITYNSKETERINFDTGLLNKYFIKTRLEKYKNRNAVDLVIPENSADKFLKLISSYSIKFSDER